LPIVMGVAIFMIYILTITLMCTRPSRSMIPPGLIPALRDVSLRLHASHNFRTPAYILVCMPLAHWISYNSKPALNRSSTV
jgi:hypothetical protein